MRVEATGLRRWFGSQAARKPRSFIGIAMKKFQIESASNVGRK